MSSNPSSVNHPTTSGKVHRTSRRPDWRGFPFQFLVITILPITFLLLAVVIGSQALHRRAMRNMVGEQDLRTVKIAASALARGIESDALLLEQIAYRYAARPDHFFADLGQESNTAVFFDGLALFSNTGDLVESIGEFEDWEQIKTAIFSEDMPAEQIDQVNISTFELSDHAASGDDGFFYLVFTFPVSTDSVFLGAESVSNLIGRHLFETASLSSDSQYFLIDFNKDTEINILYQTGPTEDDVPAFPMDAIVEAGSGTGQIRYDQTHAGERVSAFALVDLPGWVLVIQENWEETAGPSLLNTQMASLVMIPVFILAVFLLWFGVRRIVFPLQSLEKEAADLVEGDFSAIQQPVGGIQEIQSLQTTMLSMAGKLETAQDNLHSYIGALTAGVESERKSLARDLHDDTIQSLIALNQRIQWMLVHGDEREKEGLIELQDLVQGSIQNLRRMIRGLRPIYLEDLGLAASMDMLTREISQLNSIPITFELRGNERRLDSQVEIAVYRIVQEALHNMVRHSQAAQAWVDLEYFDPEIAVHVRDNGKGFNVLEDQVEFAKQGHFGLLGMKERAELIGADLSVTSVPSQGTLVILKIKHK